MDEPLVLSVRLDVLLSILLDGGTRVVLEGPPLEIRMRNCKCEQERQRNYEAWQNIWWEKKLFLSSS